MGDMDIFKSNKTPDWAKDTDSIQEELDRPALDNDEFWALYDDPFWVLIGVLFSFLHFYVGILGIIYCLENFARLYI